MVQSHGRPRKPVPHGYRMDARTGSKIKGGASECLTTPTPPTPTSCNSNSHSTRNRSRLPIRGAARRPGTGHDDRLEGQTRKWEKLAKANHEKAEQADQLQAQLDKLNAAQAWERTVGKVSSETGIPVDVLNIVKADSEDKLTDAPTIRQAHDCLWELIPVVPLTWKCASPACWKRGNILATFSQNDVIHVSARDGLESLKYKKSRHFWRLMKSGAAGN